MLDFAMMTTEELELRFYENTKAILNMTLLPEEIDYLIQENELIKEELEKRDTNGEIN